MRGHLKGRRPRLAYIDAVEGSTSLRIGGQAALRELRRQFDVRHVVAIDPPSRGQQWLARLSGTTRDPAVFLYLANYLDRATYLAPEVTADRLRVHFVGWEIEQIPRAMLTELKTADVVLATSDFVAGVFRAHLPETPVIATKALPGLPKQVNGDRSRWSLPPDKVIFLSIFDPGSGFDRKNPIDTFRAFVDAFPGRDDVRLVFKVHGKLEAMSQATGQSHEAARASEFLAECTADSRVILINEFMSYADVMALVASCDVYVSLARAEGIGLPVLEAMTLGVPTICSAYSGHLDFANAESAMLVPCTVVDIPADASHHYDPQAYDDTPQWAQPDLRQAAEFMVRLASDAGARRALGVKGAEQSADYRALCAQSEWVEDLADALASDHVEDRHAQRQLEFERWSRAETKKWSNHDRRVSRARRNLRVRTLAGRAKRALLLRGRPRIGRDR